MSISMSNKQLKDFHNRIKNVIEFHYSGPTKEKKQRVKEITNEIMREMVSCYDEGTLDGMNFWIRSLRKEGRRP